LVAGTLSLGTKLTTHPQLMLRSKMRGAQLKHRDNFTLTGHGVFHIHTSIIL